MKAIWEQFVKVSSGRAKQDEKDKFMDKVDRLMDILTSKCIIKPCAEANCSYVCLSCIHISYACSREKKIPTNDLAFIKDQRERIRTFGPRQIGSVDISETKSFKNIFLCGKAGNSFIFTRIIR